jgi:hypothetical protein
MVETNVCPAPPQLRWMGSNTPFGVPSSLPAAAAAAVRPGRPVSALEQEEAGSWSAAPMPTRAPAGGGGGALWWLRAPPRWPTPQVREGPEETLFGSAPPQDSQVVWVVRAVLWGLARNPQQNTLWWRFDLVATRGSAWRSATVGVLLRAVWLAPPEQYGLTACSRGGTFLPVIPL